MSSSGIQACTDITDSGPSTAWADHPVGKPVDYMTTSVLPDEERSLALPDASWSASSIEGHIKTIKEVFKKPLSNSNKIRGYFLVSLILIAV